MPENIQTYVNIMGRRITTINSTHPLVQDGRIIGAVEVAKDITNIVHLHDQILDLRNQLHQSQHQTKEKRSAGAARYHFSDLIGDSPSFLQAVSIAKKAARTSSPVFICGPTGTGKELIAQSIHNAGVRRHRPFIAQNCAAVPGELMEGIMFGTARGAFTGAIDRAGLFEQADGGTLFLDELNSLEPFLQAKLLRVLQDGFVRRVGGTTESRVNVRIIAAMNIDPKEALEKHILRSDLFFRLNVVNVHLPPLSQRIEDISRLTHYFLEQLNPLFGMRVTAISKPAMDRLLYYPWPGNVRELSHVIEATYNMMEMDCDTIEEHHLPSYVRGEKTAAPYPAPPRFGYEEPFSPGNLADRVEQLERQSIEDALQKYDYNITLAAQFLGIKRQALQYKMKRYNIKKGGK